MTDPAPIPPTGSADYYQQRYDDFVQRNPGVEPPDYYLGYGGTYNERFGSLDDSDLSPEGQQWRDDTAVALQQSIEDLRIEDPAAFAALERDPEAFREFAFESHPDAYVDSGLYDLSAQDLTVIALTPDIGDVLSREGLAQTLVTLGKLEPDDIPGIAIETVEQAAIDILEHPYLPPHLAPFIVHGERLFDRVSDQDWFPDLGLPDISLPKIDLPDIDLPDIDFPTFGFGGGGDEDDGGGGGGGGGRSSGALIGMDVVQVRQLAQQMSVASDQLGVVMSELQHRLHEAPWVGPEREQFVAEWNAIHRAGLNNALVALRTASRTAERNAGDQELTSATL